MFKPPNNSSLKAGLSVILAEGPSLGSQMPGSRPCEAWASHPPSLNLFPQLENGAQNLLTGLS